MMNPLSKVSVDCHFHVFDAGVAQPQARYVPRYDAPLAAWQAAAAPLGVHRGVLVQTSFMGTDNTRLVRELVGNPEVLRGVAVVAPDVGREELNRLNEVGVRGLRLNLSGVPHDMEAWNQAHRLWEQMLELGWHLEVLADKGQLPDVLRQLPEALPVVVDHMGTPASLAAVDPTIRVMVRRAQHAPVHVKLSGAYRLGGLDPGALARLWRNELGVHRLLWGSDWPYTNHESQANYPDLFAALFDWVGQAAAQEVLVENPARLYWSEG